MLQVERGSLYPALHRMERSGWLVSKWEESQHHNRELRYYRLTSAGRKQLLREETKWKQMAGAIARGPQQRVLTAEAVMPDTVVTQQN